jgi:hypothetical protein
MAKRKKRSELKDELQELIACMSNEEIPKAIHLLKAVMFFEQENKGAKIGVKIGRERIAELQKRSSNK